jgi:uracil-DNA glycosylase family 4
MFELDKLYSGHKTHGDNDLCHGCTILEKSKPCHSVLDYEELSECDTLILSDSLKYRMGSTYAFDKQEMALIRDCYPSDDFVVAASVKCPGVKEADMSPNNMNLCRAHLEATIDQVKPKLVIVCGNLAMKMLVKKSGITNKRGKSYEYSTTKGHSCKVVPILHPYSIITEPRHRFLFEKDMKNAYEKYVLQKVENKLFSYEVLTDIEKVKELSDMLSVSDQPISVDIETTGLNFLKDTIQTIAISTRDNNYVIPCDHKDSPFRKGQPDYAKVWGCLRRILENPNSRKILHNAKFDLKFLIAYGIYTKNVWDTKIMHHLIDENLPKSLMDLVKLYFSKELENL